MKNSTTLGGRILAVAASALAFGCGSVDDAGDRAAQLEQYAASFGADVDVTVDAETGATAVAVAGPGGAVGGSDLPAPRGVPKDVAIYPDLNVFSSAVVPGGHMVQGVTPDDPDEVASFYTRAMTDQGWKDESPATHSPVMRTLRFTKGTREASVNLLPTGDKTAVQITSMQSG
jgi:hypothetical protein